MFADKEAEEVDEVESEEEEIKKSTKKKDNKKKKKAIRFDEYEEEEEEEEEDEDEEINEKTKAEFKDFINDEDVEEEESEADAGSVGKSSDDETDVEDDDLELLKDNLDVKSLEEVGIFKKKRKRIKQTLVCSSEDEEPPTKEVKRKATDSSRPKTSAQAAESSSAAELNEDEYGEENDNQNEDQEDIDNFIVDDSDEDNEGGVKEVRKKRVFTDEAQQEALEIFGVNAEELGAIESDEDDQELEDEIDEEAYEEEIEDEDVELGEEGEERLKKSKKQKQARRLKSKHKIEDIFEPAELERNLMTEYDAQIRIEDKPERFMLRTVPVTYEDNEIEFEKEAQWIYQQVFTQKPSISIQESQPKPESVVRQIADALAYIRKEYLEVPFIRHYRKEYVKTLIEKNEFEKDEYDLWTVYDYDEKYCQLKKRKDNLVKLFQRMQKYQFEKLKAYTDQTMSSLNLDEANSLASQNQANLYDMRPIEDSDIERVKNVQTSEEFLDVYQHFKLYYGCDIENMREKEKESKSKASTSNSNNDEQNGADQDEDEDKHVNKKAIRRDRYQMCKLAGLNSLAKKFGLSAEQFGENIQADYQKHEIDQWSLEPNSLAQEYVSESKFSTTEQVLAAARYMHAMQIAREPGIRAFLRDLYFKRATITVKPTQKGKNEIDENHPCYAFKYLKTKPVISLKGDQFLKITSAENDGLIEVKFDVDSDEAIIFARKECDEVSKNMEPETEENFDAPARQVEVSPYEPIAYMSKTTIYDKLKQFYHKDEFSYNVEQWNKEREQIVKEALYKILYPELEKELRTRLVFEAKQHVVNMCRRKLHEWINVGPYKGDKGEVAIDVDSDPSDRYGPRVFAIVYSADTDDVPICACVNGNGELDEFIRLQKLTTRINMNAIGPQAAIDRAEKERDFDKLIDFLIEKKPHVIAVSGENKDALLIIKDLKNVINSNTKLDRKEIQIELVDNEMSKVFSTTKQAEIDYRDQPKLLRQAVCLARYLQDPLLAFSQLCNPDLDIMAIRYHPLQDLLGKDDLQKAIEYEFVNVVNSVGVDLNRCIQCPHTANVLQYVSGLGPRKAKKLLEIGRSRHPIMNRMFLVSAASLGSKVFINCAGFIRFDTDQLEKEHDVTEGDDENTIELLDATRIHPEAYEWARKMAVDALDVDDGNDANSAVKEIFECPERLKDLDLDAFADELERTGYGNKSVTLYDIKAEYNNRYQDLRTMYKTPAHQEIFHILTKETPQTFHINKLILCKVTGIARRRPTKEQLERAEPIKDDNTCTWQCSFCKRTNFTELSQVWSHFDTGDCPGPAVGVRSILDNGVSGYVPLNLLSDSHVNNPEERVKIGQMIYARIKKIDIDKFNVDLTCRSSDLNNNKPPRDEYYDDRLEQDDLRRVDERKKREEHKQVYTQRIIAHPQFKNCSYTQCVTLLKDGQIGDAIIRPSSKGNDHLTVTWKVHEDIFQHVDVIEDKKLNAFSIGKRLIIEGEDYEDLDEILARYVNPMSHNVREIVNHKYFRNIDSTKTDIIENTLITEHRTNPNKIPYVFICDKLHPGKFLLSYMVKLKCRHEYITVTPEGYRFRQRVHKTFNSLVDWFKKNYNDPISIMNAASAGKTGAGGTSSRNQTPLQNQQQRSLNANSPFIPPPAPAAYNTPRSLMSTPSTTYATTPKHQQQTPQHQSQTPSSTSLSSNNVPYSPASATPHYQLPSSDNSNNNRNNYNNNNNNNNYNNNYNNRGGGGGRYNNRGGGNNRNYNNRGRYNNNNNNYDRPNYASNNNNNNNNSNYNQFKAPAPPASAPAPVSTSSSQQPKPAEPMEEESWD